MQITELLKLTKWFDVNIVGNQIPQKYSQLHIKMNQNIRRPSHTQMIPFEAEKELLFKSIKPIDFQQLSIEQIRFLERLKITDLLGEKGINLIETILFKNNLDLATAVAKIGQLSTTLTQATVTIGELQTALSKSFSLSKSEDKIEEGFVLMRIYFQNDVAINNLADFKKLAGIWFDIGRGIAMAQDKSPEDFKIIGAEKGSIIIDLVVIAGVATVVSKILLDGLKLAERVLDIKKKAEEIKFLKLSNAKIEKELQKEAENEKEQGLNSILQTTITELGLNVEEQGDKISAIKKSIEKLIDFTQNGGVVDFVQPQETDTAVGNVREENKKLVANVKEIRKLENKMKILER